MVYEGPLTRFTADGLVPGGRRDGGGGASVLASSCAGVNGGLQWPGAGCCSSRVHGGCSPESPQVYAMQMREPPPSGPAANFQEAWMGPQTACKIRIMQSRRA